jgi:hypothetical protein
MLRALIVAGVLLGGAANAASLELRMEGPCGPASPPYALEGTGQEYCFSPDKVIDQSGIVRAQRYPVINIVVLDITPAASAKILEATTTASGKNMGVLFNGKLIFFAFVGDPLKVEKLQLVLNNAPDEVDALVAAFPGPPA